MTTKYIGTKINVLDQGHVTLVDYMGSDEAICQAARVSYGAGTKTKRDDRALIRYLIRHKHTSPLEQVQLKFHIKIPMDAWRQFVRHRTQSINEISSRYSVVADCNQKTNRQQWRFQSTNNKQGSSGYLKNLALTDDLTNKENQLHYLSREIYEDRLSKGIAREQARKDLLLSTYTEAYTSMNLHNLFHFLKLRMDSHAQLEIRQYANAMYELIKPIVPVACEAFEDYILNSITFSNQEAKWIKRWLVDHILDIESDLEHVIHKDFSKSELKEFKNKLGRDSYSSELLKRWSIEEQEDIKSAEEQSNLEINPEESV